MIYTAVEGSKLFDQVGFENATSTLGIKFKARGGGKVPPSEYHYANVDEMMFDALVNTTDKDAYFNTHIKANPDAYPYTKIVVAGAQVLPPAVASDSALTKVDALTKEQLFIPSVIDPILEMIRAEVTAQAADLDISTPENRKAIASIAFKVTKTKTFIEGKRKELVADEKKRLAGIDAEGRRVWMILEGIADEVRKPLTDFEQKDKDRIARHEAGVMRLQDLAKVPFGASADAIMGMIAAVEAIDTSTFEEFSNIASGHKTRTTEELNRAYEVTVEAERQKAEIEKLRAEAAARQQQDAIDAAVREAQEQAAIDAEATTQRLEREAAKAKQDAIDAQRKADLAAAEAAARAQKDAEAAVERERQRVADAEAAEVAAQAKREANKKHVAKINREIIDGLMGAALTKIEAECVIAAINDGRVPHVTIAY
jgi:hypothetical protein